MLTITSDQGAILDSADDYRVDLTAGSDSIISLNAAVISVAAIHIWKLRQTALSMQKPPQKVVFC
jgi:hypothetical protein